MARKKSEEAETDQSPDAVAERVIAGIKKEHGERIIFSGDDFIASPDMLIPISPTIDLITFGGFREGSWIGISGQPKFCKSALSLRIAAQAQRPEYGGRNVYYADVEGRLKPSLLEGTAGLITCGPRFNVLRSEKGNLLTAQKYLNILTGVLRDEPGVVVIIDSISALCDEREQVDGVGTETRGGGAKLFGQFVRMNMQVVPVQKSIVIGITHLIHNTSGMGAAMVEKGGQAWKYAKDYDIRAKTRDNWDEGGRRIGYKVEYECLAGKDGHPGGRLESSIRFGHGFDCEYEAVQLGVGKGFVGKSGGWLTFDFLAETPDLVEGGEIPRFNGGGRACRALKKRADWYGRLMALIQTSVGLTETSDADE